MPDPSQMNTEMEIQLIEQCILEYEKLSVLLKTSITNLKETLNQLTTQLAHPFESTINQENWTPICHASVTWSYIQSKKR